MTTARERAREAARDRTWNYESVSGAVDEAVYACTDVWEPLLKECVELLEWIDRPLKFAFDSELEADSFLQRMKEALGE